MRVVERGSDRGGRVLDGDQNRKLLGAGAIGNAARRRNQGLLQAHQLGLCVLSGLTGGGCEAIEDSLESMTQDKRPHSLLQERPFFNLHRSQTAFGNTVKLSYFPEPRSHLFATAKSSRAPERI